MMRRRRRALRAGAIALFALGGVAAASVLPVGHLLFSLRSAVHSLGAAGPPVTGLSFVVAACLFVPVTVLTIGCGYLLGPVWGVVVASLASTTAAALSFQIGRRVFGARLEGLVRRSPRLRAVQAAIGREGWRFVALLRLSPIVPFGLGNYFYGVTPLRFGPYCLATWAARVPGTILHCWLGAAGRRALEAGRSPSPLEIAYFVVGIAATATAVTWTTVVARRELRARLASGQPDAARS